MGVCGSGKLTEQPGTRDFVGGYRLKTFSGMFQSAISARSASEASGSNGFSAADLRVRWPQQATYAVVLSHDVDYLPRGPADLAAQGARTLFRHLVRQRDPIDAVRATLGLARCLGQDRDPYGCVPLIIAHEKHLGVRSSFQVAVARRHPSDVNYDVGDDATRDYLRTIVDEGFDLCLHGSYRSTESPDWYTGEVEMLAGRLQRPVGNRQHFLSFDYDTLFAAQERAGIEYDMSMGFPDRPGPRSGFSFPEQTSSAPRPTKTRGPAQPPSRVKSAFSQPPPPFALSMCGRTGFLSCNIC